MSRQNESPLQKRRAGALVHPTSLPSSGNSGTLGIDAFHFVDWLSAAGLAVWQTLPLGPTHGDRSPYQCLSVHAGNADMICVDELAKNGWIGGEACKQMPREPALREAFAGWRRFRTAEQRHEYEAFCAARKDWLPDFALFCALREEAGHKGWTDWPPPLRDRDPAALSAAHQRLRDEIEFHSFLQYVFFQQWQALRRYAHSKEIALFGDMPIFVAHDSADVWANRDYFLLDETGRPKVVAGVPPDYFSETGQRWGNPLYDWPALQHRGFRWWLARLHTQLDLFDVIRVDHFRGFEAYWEIAAHCETAVEGRWVKAPGVELFTAIRDEFGSLPLVAEDLGIITSEVEALRRDFDLPGMKILQFAFDGGPLNPYLPHNHEQNCVVYTGTHDNDTTLGWYDSLDPQAQGQVREYLGEPAGAMPWPLIAAAYMSVGRLVITPMQDFLGMGSEHRMNTPGTTEGNWRWRFSWSQVAPDLAARVRRLGQIYGRL